MVEDDFTRLGRSHTPAWAGSLPGGVENGDWILEQVASGVYLRVVSWLVISLFLV